METEIRKLLRLDDEADAKISYKGIPEGQESSIANFAVISFKSEREAARFYHQNKDMKLLHPLQIAALIQPQVTTASPTK